MMSQAFDISNKAFLASIFFWILLMWIVYTVGGYGLMAVRVMGDDGDLKEECKVKFSTDPEENRKTVHSYPKGDAAPYIAHFASDHSPVHDYPVDSNKLPPIVTAVTSSQFFQLQAFIKHVREDLTEHSSEIKLVVYDLGLYQREKDILKQYCSCEVRTLDHSVYPDHLTYTDNFAWRPLIIQTLLEEHGAVIYADVTTRFKSSNSLNFVRARGKNDFLVWDTATFVSTVGYTSKQTFQFFNETRCLFSDVGMIDSQLLVFYKTNATWHNVMKPWLKCALTPECITPRNARWDGCLHFRRPKTTGCHRYDLSALSIILNRHKQWTLAGHTDRNVPPRVTYFSQEEAGLFAEQPWSNAQLLGLMGVPLVFLVLVFRRPLHRWLASTMIRDE